VPRIERVEAWAVNVPLEATYLMAPGRFPGVSRTVVRVSTDDGVIGLGECGSAQDATTIRDQIAPGLLGREVTDVLSELDLATPRSVEQRSDGRVTFGGAQAGIEIALLDAQARAVGVPLHALLGGACRTEIQFSEYFALREGREQSPD
jgi:glucarate dehydratase